MSDRFPTFRKLSFSLSASFIDSLVFKGALWGLFVLSVFLPFMLMFENATLPLGVLCPVVGVIGIFVLIGRPTSLRDAFLRGVQVSAAPTVMLLLLALLVGSSAEPLGGAFIVLAAALCALSGALGGLVIFWVRRRQQ